MVFPNFTEFIGDIINANSWEVKSVAMELSN